MKLRQLAIGTILFFPLASVFVTMLSTPSAIASQQTDAQWRQYLNGRKIVLLSNYSSSFGGGGMSSKSELHFCSSGQFAFASESSVSIASGDLSASNGGQESSTGNWRIVESNSHAVLLEFINTQGQKQQSIVGFGQDGRLYNDAGKRLLTAASEACQ